MRLIDADALDERKFPPHGVVHCYAKGWNDAIKAIQENAPTTKARPVVRGEWIDAPYVYFGAKRYVCNQCADDEYWTKRFHTVKEHFCPNCGADMRGDGDEAD